MRKTAYISPQAEKIALPNLMTSVNVSVNGTVNGEVRANKFWGDSFPWEEDESEDETDDII